MRSLEGGWHELTVGSAAVGDRYAFEFADGRVLPDPASRFQPDDVLGYSELVAPAERSDWRGCVWDELVLYEIHIGAFTAEGTFLAAIEKLDHLANLGVTALQVMPIADFAGRRNWGYDGVFPYAPDSTYGRPEDFRRLVDAAHTRGIAVLLDVVYNHFGPEGNVFPALAPQVFTQRHHTPWGAGINFDGPDARPVREFFIDNAIYWVREFDLDGLRLDAVHAIADDSTTHFLEELAARIRAAVPRAVHLVLENEDNESRHLARETDGSISRFTAQWNDDVHHALHAAATGERAAYYSEYAGQPRLLARALAEGFAFQGETMHYRGRSRGESSAHLPPAAFVSFIQNHDQVGNRAFGDRLGAHVDDARLRAIAATYLLAPEVPMLFMGEEWNARQPFRYFCDFHGELAEAVRQGRRAEFARFPEFADAASREKIPDPQAEETFLASKLEWDDRRLPDCAEWLRWYTRILAMRRSVISPLLRHIRRGATWHVIGEQAVFVSWCVDTGERLRVSANLGATESDYPLDRGRVIWHEGEKPGANTLAPWSVRWTLADP